MTDPDPFTLNRPSVVHLPKGSTIGTPSTGASAASAPSSEFIEDSPTTHIQAERGNDAPDDVEAVLSDFVSRIQAALHVRRDEQPPQYTR